MNPEDDCNGTFPFKPHFCTAAGFKQHYIDEGKGEVIVCLHGQPTWGYLFRKFVPPLSKTHRVIVVDHMGFGKSETPQDQKYTLQTHVENLAALIEDLGLENITFVAHDWGGPIAGAYTVRYPQRVKRICLLNALMCYGLAPPAKLTKWFKWVADSYEAGTYEEIMGNLGDTILSVLQIIGIKKFSVVDGTWVSAYAAPFPNREACLGAIEWPLDEHLKRMTEYMIDGFVGVEELKKKPAMLAIGMADQALDGDRVIADFKSLYPQGPVVELDGVGHFSPEEAPETLIALIQQFIQMTGCS